MKKRRTLNEKQTSASYWNWNFFYLIDLRYFMSADFRSAFPCHTHEVYEAENSANELMDKIDSILKSTYQSSDSSDYLKQVQQNLTSLDGISFPSKDQIAYEIKVNEHQILQVVLLLNSEIKKGDSFYQIETWKLTGTQTWEADDTLPVYTGDN